jgi:hypothetical protein
MTSSTGMLVEQYYQGEIERLRGQLERERQENERLAWMLEQMTHGNEALLTYLERQWQKNKGDRRE